jgi:hypothetical protein
LEVDDLFYNKLKLAQEKLNYFFRSYRDTYGFDDYQFLFLKAKNEIPASKNQRKNLTKFWEETKGVLYKIDVYGSLAFKQNLVTGLILVNKNTSEAIKLKLDKYNVRVIEKISEQNDMIKVYFEEYP